MSAFLSSTDFRSLIHTRVCLFVERTDVALGATAIRLRCPYSHWTVPTPPLAPWSTSSSTDHGWDSEAELG